MTVFFRFSVILALLGAFQTAQAQTSQPQIEAFAADYAQVAEARELILSGDFDAGAVLALPLAEAGNPVAQNLMGIVLENNGDPDLGPAVAMYERAMAQDYPKAFHNLALLHLEDRPTFPADHAKSVQLYAEAAALGYQPSHEEWVWHLMWGDDSVVDGSQAFVQARNGVEAYPDSARLNSLLADAFYFGLGVASDPVAALPLYEVAAQQGITYAQYAAGYQYLIGEGTEVDLAKARDYFERGTASGHSLARYALADMVYFGEGGPSDLERAYDLFSEVVENDPTNTDAAYDLGYMLMRGEGTTADPGAALPYILTAYAAGNEWAIFEVPVIFAHESYAGSHQDPIRAFSVCLELDERGIEIDPVAQNETLEVCNQLRATLDASQKEQARALVP